MRLIDADVLLEHYACGDVTGIPEEDIKLAPTIDAIPIEWFTFWAMNYLTKIIASDGVFAQRGFNVALAFDEMRNDWRKENEEQHPQESYI